MSCAISECAGSHYARGLCSKHYKRQWRHGDPAVVVNTRHLAAEEKLLRETVKQDGGCWECFGSDVVGVGHVRLSIEGRRVLAHRLAYETWVGPVPAGLWVLHSCDNPKCINPEHLRVGTRSDNVRDMWQRGGRCVSR